MSPATATIPFERQSDAEGNRMCGAACLAMTYRSFGKTVTQAEIWPRISKRNNLGSLASATYLMAQDALSRGLAAAAIQAKHPLQALRACRDSGIRAILSHRLKEDLGAGHYTVLVDLDADSVVLHDPYFGPSRRLANAAFLELWRPGFPNSEITGNMLIGVAGAPAAARSGPAACHECGTLMPPSVTCAACSRLIALEPAELLGCVGANCTARLWTYLCCPFCDYTWSFALQAPGEEDAAGGAAHMAPLGRVFAEIDAFCQKIREMPVAAARPDVLQYLDAIAASKERLKLAQSEQQSHLKQRQAQLGQLEKNARQREEAVVKAKQKAEKPGQTPDGNSLGQSLLKNLDLLR